jgi:cytochrome c oxidase subunit IV
MNATVDPHSEGAREHGHIVPYATFVRVWLVLLFLTGLLTLAGTKFHEMLSVPAMLTLTPLKAGLVFYYFMHLKYERPYLKAIVFMVLAFLTLFIGFIFLDLSFR